MIILCNSLLPIYRVHAILADIGKAIKPRPVIDRITEVVAAPKTTIVCTDSNFVFRVLYFSYFFFDLWFLCLKSVIIFLMLLIWLLKLFRSSNFLSNHCSKSSFSDGADGYNLSHICSL